MSGWRKDVRRCWLGAGGVFTFVAVIGVVVTVVVVQGFGSTARA